MNAPLVPGEGGGVNLRFDRRINTSRTSGISRARTNRNNFADIILLPIFYNFSVRILLPII